MTVRMAGSGLVLLMLSGCLPGVSEPVQIARSPDPAEERLVQAALRAEEALSRLARYEQARSPVKPEPLPRAIPPELQKTVTLDWAGPFLTLAGRLAREAGYGFSVNGVPPSRPVIVDVQAENRPLIMVLRDAALQAGTAARLAVDAESQMMWVDFAEPGDIR